MGFWFKRKSKGSYYIQREVWGHGYHGCGGSYKSGFKDEKAALKYLKKHHGELKSITHETLNHLGNWYVPVNQITGKNMAFCIRLKHTPEEAK